MSNWENYENWRPVTKGKGGRKLSHYHYSGELPDDKQEEDRNLTASGYSVVMGLNNLNKGGAGSRRRTRASRHLKKHKRVRHTRRKQSRRHRHSRRRHHR